MTAHLTVIRTGPRALLQDAGRIGYAAQGVTRSGAADRGSYRQANALVGNADGAAAIECTLGGLTVRAGDALLVAVTGAPSAADVDGKSVPHATAIALEPGYTLRLRSPRSGLRSYLAVRGGFAVKTVLGSASTDTLSTLGPPPLAPGDELPIGDHHLVADAASTAGPDGGLDSGPEGSADVPEPPTGDAVTTVTTVRVLLGPRDDWFANPADLAVGTWQVSQHSDRVGVRLDRPVARTPPEESPEPEHTAPPLRRNDSRELPSEGLPLGAIQVPPSGQPVIFLADHPLTGGYPVIGVVVDDDIDRVAQLRPGQRLAFVLM